MQNTSKTVERIQEQESIDPPVAMSIPVAAHETRQNEKSEVQELEEGFQEIEPAGNLVVRQDSGVVKGDDSDGRIKWTTNQLLATLFLSGLYVGMPLGKALHLPSSNKVLR